VCQIDLLESIAKLVNVDVKSTDSQELLDVFTGKSAKGRANLVIEANTKTAFRQGDWMMIPPYSGDPILEEVNIEMGNDKDFQLYNLKKDIGQKNNLAKAQPKKLKELMKNFELIRGNSYKNVEKIELK
jgi:hypothetical protein